MSTIRSDIACKRTESDCMSSPTKVLALDDEWKARDHSDSTRGASLYIILNVTVVEPNMPNAIDANKETKPKRERNKPGTNSQFIG